MSFETKRNALNQTVETENASTSELDHSGSTWTHAFLSHLNYSITFCCLLSSFALNAAKLLSE